MPPNPERIDMPLTRREWRRRCLRRDATAVLLWAALLLAAWTSVRTHAAVSILHRMLAPTAGPGGGGFGSQIIFLKDGVLSEMPGPEVVRGADVSWRCNTVSLGDPDRPFYEEATFDFGTLTPLAPGITEDEILAHVRLHGVWLPLGGEAARLLASDPLEPHPRMRRAAHVTEEHPENVIAAIRVQWPRFYLAVWAAVAVATIALAATSHSLRYFWRWRVCRCPRCGYDVLAAEICPECGIAR